VSGIDLQMKLIAKNRRNIITRAKEGDKDAFILLIQENKTNLYRVAKAMLKHESDVEDAIQVTIIKAYEKIGKLRNDMYFKTWLIRILINQCNELLRVKKRTVSLEKLSIDVSMYEDSYRDLDLQSAIHSLKDELKAVTVLFYYEDMTTKEIAKLLKIPEGTVRSRLSKARATLQKYLKTVD
jgi:RNA polymerase sigma-70 factor, ECF subfamily